MRESTSAEMGLDWGQLQGNQAEEKGTGASADGSRREGGDRRLGRTLASLHDTHSDRRTEPSAGEGVRAGLRVCLAQCPVPRWESRNVSDLPRVTELEVGLRTLVRPARGPELTHLLRESAFEGGKSTAKFRTVARFLCAHAGLQPDWLGIEMGGLRRCEVRAGRGEKSRRAKPERLPARAAESRRCQDGCVVMREAWQAVGRPAGAWKGCASIPSGGSQGLQEGDLLAELCSGARQPGQADRAERPGGGGGAGGGGVELPPAVCKRYCMGLGTWFEWGEEGVEEGGRLTTAALTCWFGEGPRGERPKSSCPRSVARGFTSLLVEGSLGPSVCLWPSGPLHPVWDLLGPDPPWRRWWGEALLPGAPGGEGA